MTTKKLQWFKTVTRVESILMGFFSVLGEDQFLEKKVGVGLKYKILFPEENAHSFFYDKNNWQDFTAIIRNNSDRNIKWLKKITKDISDFCENTLNFCNEFSKNEFSKKTSKNLAGYLDEIGKIRSHFSLALYPPLVIDEYLEKKTKDELLAELVSRGNEENFDKYWNIITTKVQINADENEELDLLKIASKKKIKKLTKKQVNLLLQKHTDLYCWLPFYGFSLPTWGVEHFNKNLQEIQNPKDKLVILAEKRREYKIQLYKTKRFFKENANLVDLIDLIQQYLHLRTYRTEILRQFYYAILPFIKDLAKRMHLKEWIYVTFMTPEEINLFLLHDKQVNIPELRKRKKQWMMIKTPRQINFISGSKKIGLMKKKLYKINETQIIKGTVASRGLAKGLVKVINTIKEIDKVQKGDVIVATMTSPDMTIAMHKAVAIVTDEGGITCHAAIASREFGIPCIVGTKIATKMLRDGDYVNVDAVRGIITKLVL